MQVDVAGSPWMMWGPERTFPVRAITFNHRAEAFYRAKTEQPQNNFVLAAEKAGLVRVRMLDALTPAAARKYLMSFHNSFHGGSGYSFAEMGDECLAIEQNWRAYCTTKGLTSRNPVYEKRYWEFVCNESRNFSSWRQFDSTSTTWRTTTCGSASRSGACGTWTSCTAATTTAPPSN